MGKEKLEQHEKSWQKHPRWEQLEQQFGVSTLPGNFGSQMEIQEKHLINHTVCGFSLSPCCVMMENCSWCFQKP